MTAEPKFHRVIAVITDPIAGDEAARQLRAAAVALAAICSIGNLAGFVGLAVIGAMASRPGGLAEGFRFIALALSLGAALLLAQRWHDTSWAATKPLSI